MRLGHKKVKTAPQCTRTVRSKLLDFEGPEALSRSFIICESRTVWFGADFIFYNRSAVRIFTVEYPTVRCGAVPCGVVLLRFGNTRTEPPRLAP